MSDSTNKAIFAVRIDSDLIWKFKRLIYIKHHGFYKHICDETAKALELRIAELEEELRKNGKVRDLNDVDLELTGV